jgi:hypothetical protein
VAAPLALRFSMLLQLRESLNAALRQSQRFIGVDYTFLSYCCTRVQFASAAQAGESIGFTAGLKTCSTPPWDTVKPKKGIVRQR